MLAAGILMESFLRGAASCPYDLQAGGRYPGPVKRRCTRKAPAVTVLIKCKPYQAIYTRIAAPPLARVESCAVMPVEAAPVVELYATNCLEKGNPNN